MSKRKKKRNSAVIQGMCCVCDLPVHDHDGTYFGEGDFMHYDCMDGLPVADEEEQPCQP